jgi:hypothetical protein
MSQEPPQRPGEMEPLSETIRRAYEDSERRRTASKGNESGSSSRDETGPSDGENTHAQDRAVLEICLLVGLMLGLPPGEALYRGEPITARMIAFAVLALAITVVGAAWPKMKRSLPMRPWRLIPGRAAFNYRFLGISALLVMFVFVDGPDIYRRATAPVAMCWGGPCPTYEGSPLGWAWEQYNVSIQIPPTPMAAPLIQSFGVLGKNVGAEEITLHDAYMVSDIDGTKLPLKVRGEQNELIDIADAGPVPPDAEFVLVAVFDKPLPEDDFLRTWAPCRWRSSIKDGR